MSRHVNMGDIPILGLKAHPDFVSVDHMLLAESEQVRISHHIGDELEHFIEGALLYDEQASIAPIEKVTLKIYKKENKYTAFGNWQSRKRKIESTIIANYTDETLVSIGVECIRKFQGEGQLPNEASYAHFIIGTDDVEVFSVLAYDRYDRSQILSFACVNGILNPTSVNDMQSNAVEVAQILLEVLPSFDVAKIINNDQAEKEQFQLLLRRFVFHGNNGQRKI